MPCGGINSPLAWENDSILYAALPLGGTARGEIFLPAECELFGYERETGRHLVCGPQPGGGQRTGRHAAGSDRAE